MLVMIAPLLQAWMADSLHAATGLESVRLSSDISVLLGTQQADDETVQEDDLAGTVAPVGLGTLPRSSGLDAYHLLPTGDQLFSLDTDVTLPGGVAAQAADIVRYDGALYSLEFDASAFGLAGADVDAVSVDADGNLLLSFDVTVDLGGLIAGDEDLVGFDGTQFSLVFDGSAAGLDRSVDLDAAHFLESNGNLLLSFDISGSIGGLVFHDEDVVEYAAVPASWEMAYEGKAHHADWHQADLDAFYAIESCALAQPSGPVPGDGASICSSPGRLSWQAQAGVDYYTIDVDGANVFDCEGQPLGDGCSLAPGEALGPGVHSWQITAHLGDHPESTCSYPGPIWTFTVDPGVPPTAEICDGLDNDCNDVVDDELGTTSCGVGECLRTVDACFDGQLQQCVPGDPSLEVCDGLDNDCNSQIDEDEFGVDPDNDGVGNLCDNCDSVPNAGQGDLDEDSEGDACDLDDGLIYVSIPNFFSVEYQAEQGYTSFNIYRGTWDEFLATGIYTQDPGTVPLAGRFCGETGGLLFDIFVLTDPGELLFYLATGVSASGESSLGDDSSGNERNNDNPCP